jgi:O-antigen ligase
MVYKGKTHKAYDRRTIEIVLIALTGGVLFPLGAGSVGFTVFRASIFVIAGTAALFYLLRYPLYRRGFLQKSVLLLPLMLFFYSILLSTFLSSNTVPIMLGSTYKAYGSIVFFAIIMACLYIALALSGKKNSAEPYAVAYRIGISIVAVSLSFDLLNGSYFQGERPGGLFLLSVLYAMYLSVLYIYGIFYRKELSLTYTQWLLTQALIAGVVFSTRSRAAIILVVLVTITGLIYRIKRKAKISSYAWRIGAFISIIVVGIFFWSGAAGRLLNMDRLAYGIEYRYALVSHAVSQANMVPLLGYGYGNIQQAFGTYKPLPEILQTSSDVDGIAFDSAHNIFVDTWLQFGVLGFISFVFLVIYSLLLCWKNRHEKHAGFLFVSLLILTLQLSVTVTMIEAQPLLWLLILMPLTRYGSLSKRLTRVILSYVPLLAIVFAMTVLFCYSLDTNRSLLRVEQVAIFPLKTNKTQIIRGSDYNGENLAWNYEAQSNMHHSYNAADIHVPEGTEVIAMVAGTVSFVRNTDCNNGTFSAIIIKDYSGLHYLYSHLAHDSIPYFAGQPVPQGAVIGKVGSEKCSQNAAPHLHIDVSRAEPHRGSLYSDFVMLDIQRFLARSYQSIPE